MSKIISLIKAGEHTPSGRVYTRDAINRAVEKANGKENLFLFASLDDTTLRNVVGRVKLSVDPDGRLVGDATLLDGAPKAEAVESIMPYCYMAVLSLADGPNDFEITHLGIGSTLALDNFPD